MKTLFAFLILLGCGISGAFAAERPNILWITSEDNSPYLGCYGDPQAHTPNLDQLAAEGVRYRNAFSNAPVCSAARSTLILGMHATSTGLHNHRSRVAIPDSLVTYPEVLMKEGYYSTNNSKQDYNFTSSKERRIWDESSKKAHYRNREEGAPFFAVFNLTTSHESQIQTASIAKRRESGVLPAEPRIAPEDIILPPYHADTPIIRKAWSDYHDVMTVMDAQVGELLTELESEGEADNTIVFYYSDHGGAIPRGKRNIHDSGTRVPLIIRFPEKWAHLAPAEPGEWVEQPVCFVDLPATVFSLIGAEIPDHYEGVPFLGEQKGDPRDHVYLFRGRMDERYDTVRAIRDEKYLYVRNLSPHRPWGQHYFYAFSVQPGMQSWFDAWKAGETNAVQSRFWKPKPAEELYLISEDPYQINNLIEDSDHSAAKTEMRREMNDFLLDSLDTGLIPEGMFDELVDEGSSIMEYVGGLDYPAEKVIQTANTAVTAGPWMTEHFVEAMQHEHPVVRYWGITGCLVIGEDAMPALETLQQMLVDPYPDNQILAAETLSGLGQMPIAMQVIARFVQSEDEYELLAALNSLDFMVQNGHVPLAEAQALLKDREFPFRSTAARIPEYLLGLDAEE